MNVNKELIKSIRNNNLNEEEQKNLISVISGNYNYHNINSLEDLKNYNYIANQSLLDMVKESKSLLEFKNIICNDLFGIDYKIIEKTYKLALDQLSVPSNSRLLYDNLEDSEKRVMDFLRFICDSNTKEDDLRLFIENVSKCNNIRNPKSCVSLLNKLREKEIELVNINLMNQKRIEDFIYDGTLRRMEDFEGVQIYCFSKEKENTITQNLLVHNTPLNIKIMDSLEPDNGVSTISTWYKAYWPYENPRTTNNTVFYYQLPMDTQIVSARPQDGMTTKLSKTVHAQGLKMDMEYNKNGMIPSSYKALSEIAFYRRHRDHNNITNENHGGIISPNCFNRLSLDNIEKAKQNNGIIICSYENYFNFMESLKNEEGRRI